MRLNISPTDSEGGADFIDRFFTTIDYQGHDIHIQYGDCPFLCKVEHTCELEKFNVKLVICLVYPAVLGYPGDMKRIFIDDIDCPKAHRVSDEFRQKAFAVLGLVREQLPDWWLEFNMKHCWPIYHYDKLLELNKKKVISIEELVSCEILRE